MHHLLALLALALLAAVPSPAEPGGGGSVGVEDGCRDTPAVCLGAGTALPVEGSAGSTLPNPGCVSGRIVTPEAGGQSDGLPFCPDVVIDAEGNAIAVAPPPPTHAEVVAQVCPAVPPAVVGHNPREFGITGFHTWLWSAGDTGSRSASGVIRSYPVTCSVTATRFDFDTGDGHAQRYGHARSYRSVEPGGEHEGTPVQHFWEVKGSYTLSHTVTWARVSSVGADAVTRSTEVGYPVKEIVAGMTTPDG